MTEETKTLIIGMITMLDICTTTITILAPSNPEPGPEEKERQRSAVIIGLPEQQAAKLPSERIKEDRIVVTKLLDELGIEAEPVSMYRFGNPQTQARKGPRLIKLVMPTQNLQRRLLGQWGRNRVHIQGTINGMGRTFIRPSQTPEERKREYDIRQKAREEGSKPKYPRNKAPALTPFTHNNSAPNLHGLNS
jgi:hypothetical protein